MEDAGMPEQLTMFALLRPPPQRLPVELHGEVIAEDMIHSVLRLRHPVRRSTDRARIELHPAEGQWMWGFSYHLDNGAGGGHRVGPKWGKYAPSIEDAIYWAAQELREALELHRRSKGKVAILAWLGRVEPAPFDAIKKKDTTP